MQAKIFLLQVIFPFAEYLDWMAGLIEELRISREHKNHLFRRIEWRTITEKHTDKKAQTSSPSTSTGRYKSTRKVCVCKNWHKKVRAGERNKGRSSKGPFWFCCPFFLRTKKARLAWRSRSHKQAATGEKLVRRCSTIVDITSFQQLQSRVTVSDCIFTFTLDAFAKVLDRKMSWW